MMSKRTVGVAAVIISAVVFGFLPLCVTYLKGEGGTTLSVAFCRFFLSLLPIFVYLKVKKIPLAVTKKQFAQLVLITVAGYGGTALLLFFSYSYIPTGMATTLHFCYPVMVIVFSAVFLREKIKPLKILCVSMCMIGIILFYDGGMSADLFGIFLAFISGNTYAFYILYLDKSEVGKMNSLKTIFYMNSIASVMILTAALLTDQFVFRWEAADWLFAFVFATAVSFIAVLGFQIGVKYTGGQTSAILSTFEPITSVIVGIIAYGESFSARGVIGCVLILTATVIIACLKEDVKEQPEISEDTAA